MAKDRTRRNKNKTEGGNRRNKTRARRSGGTRKLSKGASNWNKAVMKVYAEMKNKNANTSFGDALKEASRRKKAGNL